MHSVLMLHYITPQLYLLYIIS